MFCIAHSKPKPPTEIQGVPGDVAPSTVLGMTLVATYRTPWSNVNDWHIYLEIPKETAAKILSRLAPRDAWKHYARFLKIQCHPVISSKGPPFGRKVNILGEIKPYPKENEAEYMTALKVVPQLTVNNFISSIQEGLERWGATHDEAYKLDTREWVTAQLDLFVERGYMKAENMVAKAKANILVHWMERTAINNIPLGTNILGPLRRGPHRRHREPDVNPSLSQGESGPIIDTILPTASNKTDLTITSNRDQDIFTTFGFLVPKPLPDADPKSPPTTTPGLDAMEEKEAPKQNW